jgi:hypothetical protein
MRIPFTQFLRPNGEKRSVSIERPADIAEKAFKLIDAGYTFEIEELRTGDISMEVWGWEDAESLAMKICENGPMVVQCVDKMINEAFEKLSEKSVSA